MLLYLVMMGSSVLMPLYVQSVRGYSATTSALVVLPGSLAMALTSPFAGKLYDKIGMKKLFVAGALCLLLSNIGMIFTTMETSIWIAAALNTVRCIAIGCLLMPLVTWGIDGIDDSLTAHGTALLTSLRTTAGAAGSAIFVGIMATSAARFTAELGDGAQIRGVDTAFATMSLGSAVLFAVSVFCVREKKNTSAKDS